MLGDLCVLYGETSHFFTRSTRLRVTIRLEAPMRIRYAVSMSVAVLVGSLALIAASAQAPASLDEAQRSRAQVKDFRPVTEAMLRKPDAADWLNWRRTD